MSEKTAIHWTDATWNPVTGCSKVSPGCAHCYAEALSLRHGWSKQPWTPENAAENVVLHPDRLDQPLHWRKPRRIFVNSMSDLFHEGVPDEFIDRVFATMVVCSLRRQVCRAGTRCQHETGISRGCYHISDGYEQPIHTFQILTKRPERMREYLSDADRLERILAIRNDPDWGITWDEWLWEDMPWPLPNVWLGVSVENQHWADQRIPLLLETPAAVRFVSAEPLLGPVDLSMLNLGVRPMAVGTFDAYLDAMANTLTDEMGFERRLADKHRLDWVIAGGETGPGHRPMNPDWARSLRDQCVAASIPFFYKQDSGPRPGMHRELDGRTWEQYPEVAR